MKYIFAILLFFVGVVPAYASVTYSRTPAGSGEYDSVEFFVDIDTCQFNPSNDIDGWSILLWDLDLQDYIESDVQSGLSGSVMISGVESSVGAVEVQRYFESVPGGTCAEVEGDYETPSFTLVLESSGGGGSGNFMTAAVGSAISTTTGLVGRLFSYSLPFLFFLFGCLVGFAICYHYLEKLLVRKYG